MKILLTGDEQQIISASEDTTVKFRDIATGECVKTLTGHTNSILKILLTGDEQQIISTSKDKTVKIWEVATGKCVKTLNENIQFIRLSTSL